MKRRKLSGSMTVEMSFLMPMILFLIMGCILAVFYYHDKIFSVRQHMRQQWSEVQKQGKKMA